MEFIAIKPGGSPIDQLNRFATERCTSIDAAIAYISDENTLIRGAIRKNVPLTLYARYDYTAPVKTHIMRMFVSDRYPSLSMRLIADIFHPKVIWWHKFGAYIGSANLTNRAWFSNFEAGIFLSEEELFEDGGIAAELEAFFNDVHERSHALTREIIDEIESFDRSGLHRAEKEAMDAFNHPNRAIPQLSGFHDVRQKKGKDRALATFVKEWDETLEIMRAIGKQVAADENRPRWVRPETPAGVQTDQFLHAFYYHRVVDGRSHPFEDFNYKNRARKDEALREEIAWWRSLPGAVAEEDKHMHEWAPFVQRHLSRERLPALTCEEFFEICRRIHALGNHAKRIQWSNHGVLLPSGMRQSERVHYLSDWLWEQKNERGESTLEVINFVLYGGNDGQVAHRIFEASFDAKRKIPHLSVSTFGEMVGWALPDKFPPRNGRTSKALNALGYDVKIHNQ